MRTSILRCATELFAERGFSGVSTRDIAKRVDIKQASLYHHFADKKSIHDAVVANSVEYVSDRLLHALRSDSSAEGRLKIFITAAISLFDSSNPYTRVTDRELMDNGNENMAYLSDSLRAPFLELAQLVRELSPDSDAEHVSYFIFSLAYGSRKHNKIRQLLSRLDDLATPRGMADALTEWVLQVLFRQQSIDSSAESANRIRALEEENDKLRRALVDGVLSNLNDKPTPKRRKK